MMAVIIEACPSFEPEWNRFCEEWQDDENPPRYVSLGDFARHLTALIKSGRTESFPDVFEAIERLHLDGDQYVREAAAVGILEGLQNNMINSKSDPEQFRPFLCPESEYWWDKLYEFWNDGKLLIDERTETK